MVTETVEKSGAGADEQRVQSGEVADGDARLGQQREALVGEVQEGVR